MKYLTLVEKLLTAIVIVLVVLLSIGASINNYRLIDAIITSVLSMSIITFILVMMIKLNDARSDYDKALVREYNNIRTQLLVTKLNDQCEHCVLKDKCVNYNICLGDD
jgi:Mn2+/Fe2+ NRAMP family transporter